MKNWKAIKAIGQYNWPLMMAIVEANQESDSGQKLQKLFPECFVEGDGQKVPLSILVAYSQLHQLKRDGMVGIAFIASEVYKVKNAPESLILPFIEVATDERVAVGFKIPLVTTEGISLESRIGCRVELGGVQYIVIENENRIVSLTREEYIDVDIEPFPQYSE